jgi:hypothetical protein
MGHSTNCWIHAGDGSDVVDGEVAEDVDAHYIRELDGFQHDTDAEGFGRCDGGHGAFGFSL